MPPPQRRGYASFLGRGGSGSYRSGGIGPHRGGPNTPSGDGHNDGRGGPHTPLGNGYNARRGGSQGYGSSDRGHGRGEAPKPRISGLADPSTRSFHCPSTHISPGSVRLIIECRLILDTTRIDESVREWRRLSPPVESLGGDSLSGSYLQ